MACIFIHIRDLHKPFVERNKHCSGSSMNSLYILKGPNNPVFFFELNLLPMLSSVFRTVGVEMLVKNNYKFIEYVEICRYISQVSIKDITVTR